MTDEKNIDSGKFLGVSAYAGMHRSFDVMEFLKAFNGIKRPAIAIVWGTFGDSHDLIREFVHKFENRTHLIEIHFSNEVGRRNGKLYDGELLKGLNVDEFNKALVARKPSVVTTIRKRIAAIRRTIAREGSTKTRWAISLGLEDNFTNDAQRAYIDIVKEWWPDAPLVFNSRFVHTTRPYEDHTIERSISLAEIINTDGFSFPDTISESDIIKAHTSNKDAWVFFIWNAQMQGLYGPTVTQPRPKNRRIVVDKDTVKAINAVLRKLQNG